MGLGLARDGAWTRAIETLYLVMATHSRLVVALALALTLALALHSHPDGDGDTAP